MDLGVAPAWRSMLGVVGDAGGGGSVRYDGSSYMPLKRLRTQTLSRKKKLHKPTSAQPRLAINSDSMQRGIDAQKRPGNHAPKPSLHGAKVGPDSKQATVERKEKTGTHCMLEECGEITQDLQICIAARGGAPWRTGIYCWYLQGQGQGHRLTTLESSLRNWRRYFAISMAMSTGSLALR